MVLYVPLTVSYVPASVSTLSLILTLTRQGVQYRSRSRDEEMCSESVCKLSAVSQALTAGAGGDPGFKSHT